MPARWVYPGLRYLWIAELLKSEDPQKVKSVKLKRIMAKPTLGSVTGGVVASICCGGSLVFASIGLGAIYASSGLWRFIPQVLAAGALSIIAINYFFYLRAAKSVDCTNSDLFRLRRGMFLSAAIGLAVMAGSFVLLEWLNHAVVNPRHFLVRPEYRETLVPGVPDIRLMYALASFTGLALLWAMPFPHRAPKRNGAMNAFQSGLRIGVLIATAGLLIALVFNAIPREGHGKPPDGQHSSGTIRGH